MAAPKRHERATLRDAMPDDVKVRVLEATTKRGAIAELLNALVIDGVLDLSRERGVLESMLEREKVASTGLGNGIATPHAKNKFAERFGVVVGMSRDGVEFEAHDGLPSLALTMWVCAPADTKKHLALMRAMATIAKDPALAGRFASCKDRLGLLEFLGSVPRD